MHDGVVTMTPIEQPPATPITPEAGTGHKRIEGYPVAYGEGTPALAKTEQPRSRGIPPRVLDELRAAQAEVQRGLAKTTLAAGTEETRRDVEEAITRPTGGVSAGGRTGGERDI